MRFHTVIVGAGSAGCVLAAKLSATVPVLLVEAGPDYLPAMLPADLADGTRNSMRRHDWGWWHRPTPAQVRFPMPRGRVVGGSSAVNTCISIRPLPRDVAEWGLPEWRWEACLPALKAIETDLDKDDDWHGSTGPLPLRRHPPAEWTAWQTAFVEAVRALGYPDCADTNDPATPEGVGPHAMNKLDGRRISAAEAWLTAEVRARPTFTLWADTPVQRVRLAGGRPTGVELVHEGQDLFVEAERVVLTAGALQTPRLLLASGIGPTAELQRLGVPLTVEAPGVGARLLDHPGFACFFRPRRLGVADRSASLIQTVLRYTATATTHPHDMQMQPGSFFSLPGLALPGVSIMASLGKPRGHGTLRFERLDAKPTVDSRMLVDPIDRARATEAMQLALAIAESPPCRALVAPLWPRPRTLRDAERTRAWIPRATDSGYHPCGTAPMGAADDPRAVTNARGRVRDTEGLYVADASLFPTIPTGNIHLSTLMVAERIGDWLG